MMRFFKVLKWLFLIIVVGIPVLLELASKYLLKQNIEFTDKLVIFKMIMTWFVTPFVLIMYYNNIMVSKLRDNPGIIAAVTIETSLNNGQVVVEHGNFGAQEILYYQSINQFLYKRIG